MTEGRTSAGQAFPARTRACGPKGRGRRCRDPLFEAPIRAGVADGDFGREFRVERIIPYGVGGRRRVWTVYHISSGGRWRDRFEADGAEGLYDRRLGKVSARRVPVDTVMEVLVKRSPLPVLRAITEIRARSLLAAYYAPSTPSLGKAASGQSLVSSGEPPQKVSTKKSESFCMSSRKRSQPDNVNLWQGIPEYC